MPKQATRLRKLQAKSYVLHYIQLQLRGVLEPIDLDF